MSFLVLTKFYLSLQNIHILHIILNIFHSHWPFASFTIISISAILINMKKCVLRKTMCHKKHDRTIRQQLLLITLSFSILMGAVISFACYYTYHRFLKRSLIQTTDTELLFLSDYIDNELNNIDELVRYCQTNSKINAFVESSDNASTRKRIEAYEALAEYCQTNTSSSYLHRVVITNLAERYIQVVAANYSSTANIAHSLPEQAFYEELLAPDYEDYNIGFLPDVFYPGRTKTITPLLKPITYKFSSSLGGYIFIEVSDDLFADALSNTYSGDGGLLYLTLGEHTYLYTDGTFTEADCDYTLLSPSAYTVESTNASVSHIRDSGGTEYVVVTEELKHSGCYVSQLISPEQMYPNQPGFLLLLMLIFLLLLASGILLNRLLDRTINLPVAQIKRRLIRISEGDFSRDTSIEWAHEFGDIGKGVNDLAENVDRMIQTTLADEKQKRDLEYKLLQSQINPHFLYNTLNSIKWMATIQGATGIMEMTTALSRLLKSIAKGTKLLIPLREELALVQDYFTIQQYRYGGTIHMTVTVDDDTLLGCPIIKFTLQPLVENAIFHGIEPTGTSGEITLHLYPAGENDLRIDITDTGVGMSEEKITRILNDESVNTSDFFKEIGISNVHKRLQYEFGSSYGITITSKLGEYTTMSILIPRQKENASNV